MKKLNESKKSLGANSKLSKLQASRLKGGVIGDNVPVPPPPPDIPSSGDGGYGG